VYLVGFIIRIYHDARSPEHQTLRMLNARAFRLARDIGKKRKQLPHCRSCYPSNGFLKALYLWNHVVLSQRVIMDSCN